MYLYPKLAILFHDSAHSNSLVPLLEFTSESMTTEQVARQCLLKPALTAHLNMTIVALPHTFCASPALIIPYLIRRQLEFLRPRQRVHPPRIAAHRLDHLLDLLLLLHGGGHRQKVMATVARRQFLQPHIQCIPTYFSPLDWNTV